jgi:hypothetical protein
MNTDITPVWTTQKKKNLIKLVNQLCLTEHIEIFKIIKKNDTIYTKNNNGIFINLSNISDDQLDEIEHFTSFCIKNNVVLDEYDKKLQECKINYNLNSRPLNNIINEENAKQKRELETKIEDDNNDFQKNEKIASFISYLEDSVESINKKKTNLKYFNAKKKYSRKVNMTSDKKVDTTDYENILEIENVA